jgi:hypothetical protein
MPTESDDRDVNEGDDTEEIGGSSKKQSAHMENSEKANTVFESWIERMIERMKTEDPLSCFKEPIKDLSFEDIVNIYSDRRRRFSESKLEEKEAKVEAV